MHSLTKFLFFVPLFHLVCPAWADNHDLQDSLSRSFEAACIQGLGRKAVDQYSALAGISSGSVPQDVRARLEEAARPLHKACNCLAGKISAKVHLESEQKVEIAVDLGDLSAAPECAPEATTSTAVQRSLMRLVEASPPPVSYIETPRAPFTVEISLSNARPSVFAAYMRPPERLSRLVFLAPGTGIACEPQNVCVDKSPLGIAKASELLVSHGRILGTAGSQNLQGIIQEFGEDARVITSGSNFSNFASSRNGATYAVRSIDGVPIEKTTAKKVWLVIFASQVPSNPRAVHFSAATAFVYELKFLD